MPIDRTEKYINLDVGALETLAEIDVSGYSVLFIQFTVGAAALTDFLIEYSAVKAAGYFTAATAAGDFTTPGTFVEKASGDLNSASVGNHWIKLNVKGIGTVKLSAAGVSSTVALFVRKG